MKYAVINSSFVDSPTGTALVVLGDKCNLKCPYCYNWELITGKQINLFTADQVLQEIQNNKEITKKGSFIKDDWLILSGGEPQLMSWEDISCFISEAKKLGMKIGVFTNGTASNDWVFLELFTNKNIQIDFINLDFKVPFPVEEFGFSEENFKRFQDRLKYVLINSEIQLQLSTVLIPKYHSQKVFQEMIDYISLYHLYPINIKWRLVQMKIPEAGCYDQTLTTEDSYSLAQIETLVNNSSLPSLDWIDYHIV